MRMEIKYLFFCGLLCVIVKTGSSQDVLRKTEYGIEGQSKTLVCPLTSKTTDRRYWNGPPGFQFYFINSQENEDAFRAERLGLIERESSNDLLIVNLTKGEDEGEYKCGIFSNNITREYIIELQFLSRLTSVSLIPGSITVRAGQNVELTCETSFCNPQANVSWHKSSTDITSESTISTEQEKDLVKTISTLLTTVMKADNREEVYCKGKNIPDQDLKSNVLTLNVLYKPYVKSNTKSPYNIKEFENASLECTVTDANPETGISWKWLHAENSSYPLPDGPVLTIPNIQRDMSGAYTCTAKNTEGQSDPITIEVIVEYKPDVTLVTKNPYRVEEGKMARIECKVIAANPNASIIWKWFHKGNPLGAFFKGPIYSIPNIQRDSLGSYSCTATNSVGTSKEAIITVDVQYKPEVISTLKSQYPIIEGQTAELECTVTNANPDTNITWKWYKSNIPGNVLYRGPIYSISNIKRDMKGSYNCTAKNSIGESLAAMINIDVHYKPDILDEPTTIVNETDYVLLSREIVSNPLANVSWYNGSELLYTLIAERNATFIIKKAVCTDTKNFTLVASNTVKENVSALVELIVNCKPRSIKTNFTLGVTDTTGIEFSTLVTAYPEPEFELKPEIGTINNQMTSSMKRNGINNFTIHLSQAVVNQSSLGIYHLIITNAFGNITIFVNVISQRKPFLPENIEINCEVTRARVQWTSSFDGGDPQSFTVIAVNGPQSDKISDKGESKIHETFVQSLQSSTTYVFYVSARNRHGYSLSKNISCTTLAESSDNLPLIAGGAAAGGIALTIIVIVIVVFLRVHTKHEKQAGKSQRFENEEAENKEADDDGMRDNILYVSAGPKVDEKPEAAVYAAVNKKAQASNNNANTYAEVNKSGHIITEGALYSDVKQKRGFFKKDLSRQKDGNPRQKKGKKQKSKQDIADVYENSEDIAMSSKSDNVYSNTGQKVQNKEERGYKNKDGLLYVEVQFDAKTEKGNKTIHGEDEKTDYATVEFPMVASRQDESGNEKL